MHLRTPGLLAASLSLLAACGGAVEEPLACETHPVVSITPTTDPVCNNFTSSLVLKNRAGNVISNAPRGEAVTLEYKVTNNSSNSQTLQVADGCGQADLSVDSVPVCTVYRSHDKNRVCTAAVTPMANAAGETKTFSSTWQQTDLAGRAVPTGDYAAVVKERSQCSSKLSFGDGLKFRVQ